MPPRFFKAVAASHIDEYAIADPGETCIHCTTEGMLHTFTAETCSDNGSLKITAKRDLKALLIKKCLFLMDSITAASGSTLHLAYHTPHASTSDK